MVLSRRVLLVLALVSLASSLVVPFAAPARAQGTASLTIQARFCPDGNPFVDPNADCQPPQPPVSFAVDGGAARAVDADGAVTFTGLAAGDHRVTETEGASLGV